MLYAEFNLDDAIAVRYEEGIEKGIEKGIEEGIEKGRVNEKLEIARNALAEGATFSFIQKITGLDLETIEGIKN